MKSLEGWKGKQSSQICSEVRRNVHWYQTWHCSMAWKESCQGRKGEMKQQSNVRQGWSDWWVQADFHLTVGSMKLGESLLNIKWNIDQIFRSKRQGDQGWFWNTEMMADSIVWKSCLCLFTSNAKLNSSLQNWQEDARNVSSKVNSSEKGSIKKQDIKGSALE